MLDATTRLSHAQPMEQAIANLDPTVSQDFAEEWRQFIEMRGQGLEEGEDARRRRSGFSMDISDLLNE